MVALALAPAIILFGIASWVLYGTSLKFNNQTLALKERGLILDKIFDLVENEELTYEELEKELDDLRPVCIFVDRQLELKWPRLSLYADTEKKLLRTLARIQELDKLQN